MDTDGNLIANPTGNSEDALPLSTEGLAALQDGQVWWEESAVDNIPLLIYSRPVVTNDGKMLIVQVAKQLTERNNTLKDLASTLVIAGVITTLAAFGIGWFISGITLRPIHRITHTAQEIGKERDFTRRVEYHGPSDEVGQLAITFNNMLTRLQDAYQRVAQSLEMQRNFVADVSHELRTPLTTLRGNLSLLQRKPAIPELETQDILKDMESESDRLIRLVNDLLILARADAGRSFTRELIPLQPLAEEVIKQVCILDPDRQVEARIDPGITVLGDRDALKQILLVVLDNAIKHTDAGITLHAKTDRQQVSLTVQDQGEGIAPEVLEHVFDRFYRAPEEKVTDGFGLGLPIAKALIESQGGSITLESEPGHGSKVVLMFPTDNSDVD